MGQLTVTALRAKTDRQLQTIIRRELDRGLALARRSTYEEAHRAMWEASQLLPVVDAIPEPERRQLNLRLTQLARMLAAEDNCMTLAAG